MSAEISKYDIDDVKVGQQAVIWIGDEKYKGQVTEIERIAIEDRQIKPKFRYIFVFRGIRMRFVWGLKRM